MQRGAVLFAELGQTKEAREAWHKAYMLNPNESLASLRDRLPYKRPQDLDRLLTAARQVGMQ